MNLGNASGPSLEAVAVSRRGDAVARRSKLRAQDEFAIKTARLKTAVRAGHLIKGDPLGNARLDGTRCQ